MKYRKINILGYPTNKASSGGYSSKTPVAFERIIFPHLISKYGIEGKFEMIPVNDRDSAEKNGINNYDSIYDSMLNLCIAQCNKLWSGNVPITIGGDHAQGFPTVKSSLFIHVLRSLTENSAYHELKKLADSGKFLEASQKLDALIRQDKKLKTEVKRLIKQVHVIWVDAHGDFNSKDSSGSGNFHGMSLGAACGLDVGGIEQMLGEFIRAEGKNVHIMCARDLDKKEKGLLKKYQVDFEKFEMHHAESSKIKPANSKTKNPKAVTFDKAFTDLVKEIKNKNGKIILSTDIDHLSLPETGTPLGAADNIRKNRFGESPSGPVPLETYHAFRNIAQDSSFIAFDITEVALGYAHSKTGKFVFGIKACIAGINILASMLGGDAARKYIFRSVIDEGHFRQRLAIVAKSMAKN